ncbi:hypothetical protein EV175_004890 [Coemansia sp. RSA 1933]|nr:hypothetical protein EV175_004890 [Coemansia sp. RSA 1933]
MAQYKEIPELGPGVFGFDLAKGEVTKINGRYPKLLASAWLLREMCDLACIVNVPCSAHEGLRCDRQEEDPEFWHEYRTVPHKLSVVGFGLAFAALAEKRNIRSVDVDPLLNGPDSAVDDVGFVKVDRTSAEKAAAVTTGEPSTTEPVAETSANTKRDTKLHGLSRLVKAAKLGSKVSPPNIPKVH